MNQLLSQAFSPSIAAAFQLASQHTGVRSLQTSAAQQRAQDSDSSETPQKQQPSANGSKPDPPPAAEHERAAAAAAAATSPGAADETADEGSPDQDEIRAEADTSELVTAATGAAGDDLSEGLGDGDYSGDELEDIEASMEEEDAQEAEDDGYQSEDDMTEDEKLVHSVTTASKKRQRYSAILPCSPPPSVPRGPSSPLNVIVAKLSSRVSIKQMLGFMKPVKGACNAMLLQGQRESAPRQQASTCCMRHEKLIESRPQQNLAQYTCGIGFQQIQSEAVGACAACGVSASSQIP